MEISEMIKEARIKKGMTQQELANSVYVTRQTISKWELGKSIPDEASLSLLCQCLEIDNQERNIFKKFAADKQPLLLIILAVVFSPAVIGIRYCLFKMGKLEDKKFKIMNSGYRVCSFCALSQNFERQCGLYFDPYDVYLLYHLSILSAWPGKKS